MDLSALLNIKMATLDDYMEGVTSQETKRRLQAHAELVPFLSDPHSSMECSDIDQIIEGLSSWVKSSNFKVSGIKFPLSFFPSLSSYDLKLLNLSILIR